MILEDGVKLIILPTLREYYLQWKIENRTWYQSESNRVKHALVTDANSHDQMSVFDALGVRLGFVVLTFVFELL